MAFRSEASHTESGDDAFYGKGEEDASYSSGGVFRRAPFYDTSGNWCDGLRSEIVNVTTNYTLMRVTKYSVVPLHLNLRELANSNRELFGWSYNPPKSMPAVKLNVECAPYFSKMNVALYSSGSVVQTGCQSPEQARLAAHMFARTTLRRIGLNVVVTDFRVDNMVAKVNMKEEKVNLSVLKRYLGARCVYTNPKHATNLKSSYSAAIIRSTINPKSPTNPRGENIKILMYDTAYAVMMGVTSRDSIIKVVQEIDDIVKHTKEMERAIIPHRQPVSDLRLHMEKIKDANKAIRQRIGKF